jgi:enoyl-CoA hydratase/carnithine racemase
MHTTGDGVAVIELTPGPLADIASARAARLSSALEGAAAPATRALLVLAPDGLGDDEPRVPTPRGLRDPAASLAAFPSPTVAVWNGAAIGAGAELVLAADIRVIGPDATMAFPEVGAGALPCWGGTQRLPRAGGIALALRMLVIGDTADATMLHTSGLAVCVDDPVRVGAELAARLARGAPRAQEAARDAVHRGLDLTLADGLRLESDLNLLLSTTADRAEGIAAFFDKREPRFTGE